MTHLLSYWPYAMLAGCAAGIAYYVRCCLIRSRRYPRTPEWID